MNVTETVNTYIFCQLRSLTEEMNKQDRTIPEQRREWQILRAKCDALKDLDAHLERMAKLQEDALMLMRDTPEWHWSRNLTGA
jgi:hypothetical protein